MWEPFQHFVRLFFELPLLMLLGAHVGDFGLPMGPQWEFLFGPKLDVLRALFLRQFLGPTWQRFGEGPTAGAEPV